MSVSADPPTLLVPQDPDRQAHTHGLFVGEVEQADNHDDIAPLLWVDHGFASAAR